jgi:hypothetical protein
MCAFSSFGLWWAIAPRSVIRFYAWFHQRRLKRKPVPMPSLLVVRISGIVWVVIVVYAAFFGNK